MEIITIVALILFACALGMSFFRRIPKTGREGIKTGEEVIATITNNNKGADRAVTLKAKGNGRRFKVKIKPDEAYYWIKGDKIKVILSPDNPLKYRILFNDYFRENEARIREAVLNKLEKVNDKLPGALLIKYKKETYTAALKSSLTSQRIFTLYTAIRTANINTALLAVFVAMFLWLKSKVDLSFGQMMFPLVIIIILLWSIYVPVNIGAEIKKEVERTK